MPASLTVANFKIPILFNTTTLFNHRGKKTLRTQVHLSPLKKICCAEKCGRGCGGRLKYFQIFETTLE